MRKTIFGFIVILFFVSVLKASATDSLYLGLREKADANLKYMPSYAKRGYQKLLKSHPDRLMAFLIAYEENGRLTAVDPQIVQNHWQSVKELMKEQNINEPDEFFLSYVAKITVSDEAISDYRNFFEGRGKQKEDYLFDGLNLKELRNQIKDPVELYRLACLKCTELLRYRPTSGRDQSPLDVAANSLIGRCEESQILFVALCRTLGIPARAASTPWWAHQNDNHAWAEVFINGKWYYSGDSDSAYWLNQTWFSSLTGKMVLVLADGTLPEKGDEVLSSDEYGVTINSVMNYSEKDYRKISIRVTDKLGKPVKHCPLSINVYNFHSLRAQAIVKANDKGEKTITAGQGAFYLLAFKDSLATLQFVPSGNTNLSFDLILDKSELKDETAVLKYPSHKTEFKEAPQSWKDDITKAKAAWQKRFDQVAHITSPNFFGAVGKLTQEEFLDTVKAINPDNSKYLTVQTIGIYNLMKQYPGLVDLQDTLFFQVLKQCHFNINYFLGFNMWRVLNEYSPKEIKRYLKENNRYPVPKPISQDWLKVLLENDSKDLWQANGWLFLRMYRWYQYIAPKVSYLPREEFLNLLEPTVFYENLPWKAYMLKYLYFDEELYPKRMRLKKPLKPSPQQVVKFYKKKHKIDKDIALKGLIPMDVALFQKRLTGYQYKILAVCYLRANGIPANYSRIPNVVSVYTDSTWKYFDLAKNGFYETEKENKIQTRKVTFNLVDEAGQPVALDKEQLNLCFIRDGQFFSLNQQAIYKGNGIFETEIPSKGTYYAQIGYRSSDSLTVYYLRNLSSQGKPPEQVNLTLLKFNRKWSRTEDFLKPIIDFGEKTGYLTIVLGNYSQENSIRLVNKLKEKDRKSVLIGYEEGRMEGMDYLVIPEFLNLIKDIPSLQNRTITLAKNQKTGSWQMYEGLWDKLPE